MLLTFLISSRETATVSGCFTPPSGDCAGSGAAGNWFMLDFSFRDCARTQPAIRWPVDRRSTAPSGCSGCCLGVLGLLVPAPSHSPRGGPRAKFEGYGWPRGPFEGGVLVRVRGACGPGDARSTVKWRPTSTSAGSRLDQWPLLI